MTVEELKQLASACKPDCGLCCIDRSIAQSHFQDALLADPAAAEGFFADSSREEFEAAIPYLLYILRKFPSASMLSAIKCSLLSYYGDDELHPDYLAATRRLEALLDFLL